MYLNVGCGDIKVRGWLNLDTNVCVCPDVVGSLLCLPDEVRDVERVYMGHVLEHIRRKDLVVALRDLWSRCKPGALIGVVGPDCVKAEYMYNQGIIDKETLEGALFGAGRWEGDSHAWRSTHTETMRILRRSNILDVRQVWVRDREFLEKFPVAFPEVEWQFALQGVVP